MTVLERDYEVARLKRTRELQLRRICLAAVRKQILTENLFVLKDSLEALVTHKIQLEKSLCVAQLHRVILGIKREHVDAHRRHLVRVDFLEAKNDRNDFLRLQKVSDVHFLSSILKVNHS